MPDQFLCSRITGKLGTRPGFGNSTALSGHQEGLSAAQSFARRCLVLSCLRQRIVHPAMQDNERPIEPFSLLFLELPAAEP
jgi:hypothetical protein